MRTANTSATKKANRSINRKWLVTTPSLASDGRVVHVQDDQHVQKARDDEEGVGVLEGDGRHLPLPPSQRPRGEVREPEGHVGRSREEHQRLRGLEGKQPALEREADGE